MEFKPGTEKIIGGKRFKIKNTIGSGQFGTVYLATDPQGNPAAIKQISRKDDNIDEIIDEIQDEIDLLNSIKYRIQPKNQCKDYAVCIEQADSSSGDDTFMLLNYLPGKFEEHEANLSNFIYKLITNLKKLVDAKISHQDIKEENIRLDSNGNPVFVDFGRSCYLNDKCPTQSSCIKGCLKTGTLSYAPPEVVEWVYYYQKNHPIANDKFKAINTPQVIQKYDLWSLGVVILNLYEKNANQRINRLMHNYEFKEKFLQERIDCIIVEKNIPDLQIKNLLFNLLTVNYNNRVISDIKPLRQMNCSGGGNLEITNGPNIDTGGEYLMTNIGNSEYLMTNISGGSTTQFKAPMSNDLTIVEIINIANNLNIDYKNYTIKNLLSGLSSSLNRHLSIL